jgi:hypothetical protein
VAVYVRVVVLLGGALLALFGSAVLHFPGSGALAVLTMAFTAGNDLYIIFFYFYLQEWMNILEIHPWIVWGGKSMKVNKKARKM